MTNTSSPPGSHGDGGVFVGERTVQDPRFGAVTLSGHGAVWTADGPSIDRCSIQGMTAATLTAPRGTGDVRVPKIGVRRRAKDVRVTVAGRAYHLHHESPRRAQLRRDDLAVGHFRGLFRLPFTKGPSMLRPYEIVDWAPAADSLDAGVAHVLLACFGAGADGAVLNVLTLWS